MALLGTYRNFLPGLEVFPFFVCGTRIEPRAPCRVDKCLATELYHFAVFLKSTALSAIFSTTLPTPLLLEIELISALCMLGTYSTTVHPPQFLLFILR